jgi:murein tripeptide amidase MpaA
MKGHIILVLALAFTIFDCSTSKVRYDGYKVLQVDITNQTDLNDFLQLAEEHLVDIWATNIVEGWVHVMLPPHQLDLFQSRFLSKVHIDNVQDDLDRSEAEQARENVGFFEHFPTTLEVSDWIDEQVSAHNDIAERIAIGFTARYGEEIFGIRIGDPTKPLIVLHCTIHAREWITTTTCCWIIESLLTLAPVDADLLEQFQWIIVPILNIDGYDYAHQTNRLWRKNLQLNTGSTCIGTDLNRNYGFRWAEGGSSSNPCSDIFHGASPFSASETNAEQEYFKKYTDNGDLKFFVDIHAYGGQFMSPYGWSIQYPPDYAEMETLMTVVQTGIRSVNGRNYAIGPSARVIYIAAGGSDDNFYGTDDVIYSFTTECFGSSFTPPPSNIAPIGREIWAGIKAGAKFILMNQ